LSMPLATVYTKVSWWIWAHDNTACSAARTRECKVWLAVCLPWHGVVWWVLHVELRDLFVCTASKLRCECEKDRSPHNRRHVMPLLPVRVAQPGRDFPTAHHCNGRSVQAPCLRGPDTRLVSFALRFGASLISLVQTILF
jgi:hypothetical protein